MSNIYRVRFVPETIHSATKNKDYYFLRACLYDGDLLVAKGIPIVWLTKEQYESYASAQ